MSEEGITNLGPVPRGMTFLAATQAMRGQRKYEIDYYRKGDRLTLCDTLRHMWRVTDGLPEGGEREALREYIAAAADYAKRMNHRMVDLKKMLESAKK